MSIQVSPIQLPFSNQKVNGFLFIPSPEKISDKSIALFTHGYTSHKGSILNWPLRLAEEGTACVLFDLPGHYLGTFSEVESIEEFQKGAPKLFESALNILQDHIGSDFLQPSTQIILGGHSLGALLALKAMELNFFQSFTHTLALLVGFGLPPEGVTHIFDTPFYKSTLKVREQLVSQNIPPNLIFPWIKKEKENLKLKGRRIHFITGQDDMVVGKDGSERLAEILTRNANKVTLERPAKLPHHLPEMAAPHIKKWLKDHQYL